MDEIYEKVQSLIEAEKLDEAQQILDGINERYGCWHYLQSKIFRRKNWMNECRKELETAIALEPDNITYMKELESLAYVAQEDGLDDKKGKRKRKKNLGATEDKAVMCALCSLECCCEGCAQSCCEGICNGCS